jgi:dGTP triphosphohydrolase
MPYDGQSKIASEGVPRVVTDYLAGMTDHYILQQYAEWVKQQ